MRFLHAIPQRIPQKTDPRLTILKGSSTRDSSKDGSTTDEHLFTVRLTRHSQRLHHKRIFFQQLAASYREQEPEHCADQVEQSGRTTSQQLGSTALTRGSYSSLQLWLNQLLRDC